MAAQKFLTQVGGLFKEAIATVTGGSSTQSGQIPALDANGKLDASLMPTGIGADTVSVPASEALSAGAFVNLYANVGVLNARNADGTAASAGKPADGFVLASVASSGTATVYLAGQNNAVTGATPGDVFLSDSAPGGAAAAAPTTTGHTVQAIGKALSATVIDFKRGAPIQLA